MARKKSASKEEKKQVEKNIESIFSQSSSENKDNLATKRPRRKPNKTTLALIILVIIALAGALYFWRQAVKLNNNPELAAQKETQKYIAAVAKLMKLPENEEPTLATVTDKEKVNNQPFFKESENGDKVLIYPKAQKAILFRPSINKIINVSSVYKNASGSENNNFANQPIPKVNGEAASSEDHARKETEQKNESEILKLALYNGTKTNGLTFKAEKRIKEVISDFEVVVRENALKQDYEKTLVVDIPGKKEEEVKKIAEIFSAEIVDQIPEGEEKPQADVLIILGKNN